MPRFLRIDRQHPLYPQEVELRKTVLLEPLGLTWEDLQKEFPGFEDSFEHFVGVIDHPKGERVVGCVCLYPNMPKPGVGKLMQMAVDPQRQHEGLGRRLVIELERRAFGELGLTELFCHAQEGARGFYEKLGWRVLGKPFDEAGIKHFKMVFRP